MLYIIFGTTHMLETGQDWKIAALTTSMRVYLFICEVKNGPNLHECSFKRSTKSL